MSKVYFTVAEFTHSDNAVAAGVDNTPNAQELRNIEETIAAITPFRIAWGAYVAAKWPGELQGINVSSGYRNEWTNKKAGGVDSSAHRVGWAADLQPANKRINEFLEFARCYWNTKKAEGVKFDQVIIEKDSKGTRWLHFGLKNQQGVQRLSIFDAVKA